MKEFQCKHCKRKGLTVKARGLCGTCYSSLKENGTLNILYPPLRNNSQVITENIKCKVAGCDKYSVEDGYCKRHKRQITRYGYIKERTKHDKNEIIINEELNCAEIVLYNNKSEEIARTLIDIEDVERVKEYKWNLAHQYVFSRYVGHLHRFIMNVNKEEVINNNIVDHVNRNRLDNRKENLRIVTSQENVINSSIGKNNTSGIMGVRWVKQRKKWLANIGIDNKSIFLGLFNNKEEAIIVRLEAELKYWGIEFAPQRHLFKEYGIIQ